MQELAYRDELPYQKGCFFIAKREKFRCWLEMMNPAHWNRTAPHLSIVEVIGFPLSNMPAPPNNGSGDVLTIAPDYPPKLCCDPNTL
jgi:hypothetical protein